MSESEITLVKVGLAKRAQESENDKVEHLNMLISKRKDKCSGPSKAVQYIHDLRIKCVFTAYFPLSPPECFMELSRELVAMEGNIFELNPSEEEHTFICAYQEALTQIEKEDGLTTNFDKTEGPFHQYRYNLWKKDQENGGWSLVENKQRRGRKYRKKENCGSIKDESTIPHDSPTIFSILASDK